MSHQIIQGDCIEVLRGMPDESVDLVFGSPPYADARLYLEDGEDLGISRGCQEWIDWMLTVTTEAVRVCRGPVLWVASNVTRDRNYWPACEGLMYEWWKRGGSMYRPCCWVKATGPDGSPSSIPGSGHDDWFRHDWEYVMCFKRPGALAWSDNTACGHKPRWGPGGEMSHRMKSGTRVNQWGKNVDKEGVGYGWSERQKDGELKATPRKPSHKIMKIGEDENSEFLSNPGTVVYAMVGGGHLGHALAHENEAPFPEKLAERFVLSFCQPGGTVCDPFMGSGTTLAVALSHGRNSIGIDLRESQCRNTRRRLADTQLSLI